MSPVKPEKLKANKEEKKQQILDAAEILFSEQGYHAASIANIAKKSGISKGLMYSYFENKEDLLNQLVISRFKILLDYFLIDNTKSKEENLVILIDRSFDVLIDMENMFMIYFSIMFNRKVFDLISADLESVMEPLMVGMIDIMAKLGFEKPFEEAFFLRSVLDGLSMNYLLMGNEFPKDYCINRIKKIYLK